MPMSEQDHKQLQGAGLIGPPKPGGTVTSQYSGRSEGPHMSFTTRNDPPLLTGPLNALARQCYEQAKKSGFWQRGVKDRNKGEMLLLAVSEILEAFEEIRDGHDVTEIYFSHKPSRLRRFIAWTHGETAILGKPEGVPIELADAFIRLLDTCHAWGIDIDAAIDLKRKYNATRPFMHNKLM